VIFRVMCAVYMLAVYDVLFCLCYVPVPCPAVYLCVFMSMCVCVCVCLCLRVYMCMRVPKVAQEAQARLIVLLRLT
jgi:hypothetical protein